MKKKLPLVLFWLLSFILLSCSSSYDRGKYLELSKPSIVDEGVLGAVFKSKKELNITLPENVINSNLWVPEILDDTLLYYMYENNKIAVVNLNSAKVDSIVVPLYHIDANIVAFYPISADSILLVQDYPPVVFLIDNNDSVFYKKNMGKVDFETNNLDFNALMSVLSNDDFNYNIDRYKNCYVDKGKGLLHIGISPVDYLIRSGMSATHTIGVFDLKKGEWHHTYGKARGLMKYSGSYCYGHIHSIKFFLVKGDTTIISYPISHDVYLVNNNTDSLIAKYHACSRYSTSIGEPYSRKVLIGDYQRRTNWRIKNPYYDKLMYYPEKKMYSRLYVKAQELYDTDGKLNSTLFNRNYVMLLFNEDFELIADYEITDGEMSPLRNVPTSKGLLVAKPIKQEGVEASSPELLQYTDIYETSEN